MSHARHVKTVAAWEFRRYFKWKDQIIGLVLFMVVGVVWAGAAKIAGARGGERTVGLVGFAVEAGPESRLKFVEAPLERTEQLAALEEGELDAILSRTSDGSFELLVAKDPRFRAELELVLGENVRRERLTLSGLSSDELEHILEPAALVVSYTKPEQEHRRKTEKIAVAVCIGSMLLAIFTSMAYMMTGIAGEKQLRVTESVVAAISPQAWVDGKVLGISAYALATVGNMAVGWGLVALGVKLATDLSFPTAAMRPGVFLALLLYSILGLLLWNAFFAAIASTLDDPNTSSRSSLMMLPALPVVMSLALLRDPDTLLARILAIFPLTSAPALPIRLVLSDPGWLEVLSSVVLLLGAIWVVRRLAGRIFEVGMMLYGQEPSFGEMLRWMGGNARKDSDPPTS